MADIVWIIIASLLLLAGAVGTIAPIIPGLPLSWGGLLILKFVPSTQDDISWNAIILLAIITVLITVLDNVLPVWGTKKMGGNKKVVWGATIGLFIGFFLGPWGIIFGPFIGAFIGAIMSGNRLKLATKQASGAFGGYLVGLLLKLIVVGFIIFFFVRTLIIN
jgi:uncharacterized protein YqgC (DUF456 family)